MSHEPDRFLSVIPAGELHRWVRLLPASASFAESSCECGESPCSCFAEKRDKRGYRICYDDDTGKRVKCPPLPKEKKERKPAAKKPETPPGRKQSHELTLAELLKTPGDMIHKPGADNALERAIFTYRDSQYRQAYQGRPPLEGGTLEDVKREHKKAILAAAEAGQTVPEAVLADYPGLKLAVEDMRPKGKKPPAAPKAKAAPAHTVDSAHAALLKAKAKPEDLTPEHMSQFATMLGSLKNTEIQEVNKRLSGVKGSGAKPKLIEDLFKRLGIKAGSPKPEPEVKEPEPEKPKPPEKPLDPQPPRIDIPAEGEAPAALEGVLAAYEGAPSYHLRDRAAKDAIDKLSPADRAAVFDYLGIDEETYDSGYAPVADRISSELLRRRGGQKSREPEPKKPQPAPPPAPKPAPPVKPAAAPSPNVFRFDPDLHPLAKEHLKRIGEGVKASKGLTTEQRQAYMGHAQEVLKRMPEAALKRFGQGQHDPPVFVPDTKSVRGAIAQLYKDDPTTAAALAKVKGTMGGAYVKRGGKAARLVLDGDHTQESQQRVGADRARTATQLYAHEFSHAIDGPQNEYSGSREWKTVFAAEMGAGQLNKYSATKPSEGFAEFGRLLFAGDHDPAEVEARFPRCYAYWQSKGLVSQGESAMPEQFAEESPRPMLDDVFVRYVELPDGNHLDLVSDDGSEEPDEQPPQRPHP